MDMHEVLPRFCTCFERAEKPRMSRVGLMYGRLRMSLAVESNTCIRKEMKISRSLKSTSLRLGANHDNVVQIGVATRSHALQTINAAELDAAEHDAKGDTSAVSANIASGTLRAGDRISEITSSGRLSAIVFAWI
ncbi:hypothetical protein B0H17DRAFT_1132047 [Mycena rosella]|uniref:Uncharacterized protein n=1 Tax=Mycena rosella TaxID=1033263 RepID=A0AAD7GGY5_MYCRO|nr:hypothetical protein B0H17DRAFT_1132047 [Mycena rosella]